MWTEVSVSCSQDPAAGHYPESDQCSPLWAGRLGFDFRQEQEFVSFSPFGSTLGLSTRHCPSVGKWTSLQSSPFLSAYCRSYRIVNGALPWLPLRHHGLALNHRDHYTCCTCYDYDDSMLMIIIIIRTGFGYALSGKATYAGNNTHSACKITCAAISFWLR
jgi:hypothetical protein